MKQRLLLFIITLLTGATASAQTISYGLTARVGGFKTFASNNIKDFSDYEIGPQIGLGAWLKLPLDANSVQVMLLQTAEIQKVGEVQYYERDTRTMYETDLNYRTFSVQLTGVYLYAITDKIALGAGAGARHTFKAEGIIESSSDDKAPGSTYDLPYRDNVTLLLPLEAHFKLNDHFTLLAQTQLQLTNRLKNAEEGYWERDLGFALGVNYTL